MGSEREGERWGKQTSHQTVCSGIIVCFFGYGSAWVWLWFCPFDLKNVNLVGRQLSIPGLKELAGFHRVTICYLNKPKVLTTS